MNKENIEVLIDYLRNCPPERFNMFDYAALKSCGTVCCIAGATCQIIGLDEFKFDDRKKVGYMTAEYLKDGRSIFTEARKLLRLTHNQAEWLFYGYFVRTPLEEITKDQAIRAMRYLLENEDEENLEFLTPN